MRVNVLQHTPNEGPGSIKTWANQHHYEFYVYHPETFGKLPTVEETDLLIILGGPMSPNDDLIWIKQERKLIKACLMRINQCLVHVLVDNKLQKLWVLRF